MKVRNIYNAILISFLWNLMIASCQHKNMPKDFPDIKAEYSIYQNREEKGYTVSFVLSNGNYQPTAVVINKIEQKIVPEHKEGLHYHIDVKTESRILNNFKPEASENPNGIFFRTNSGDYFQKVNFKLK
ncbi:hypothetical protein HNP38_002594 [Chryseobacterium defluvii]|uniref:Lipoprotein n=1 Tax=Chryseobacterium defluvii TaxID=160396 RepID=A0A840KIH9_9FLAO|nr:hypothetical protein [Chryseobacterium defluvii]MBB4807290.1 hypothetical protein [Chryseobacterium defluvii]